MTLLGPKAAATVLTARTLHPGSGAEKLLLLAEPLSMWGGVSAEGNVIDRHHPQLGTSLTGRVVAMTAGRGSSSSSSVLAELIRARRAPAAIILAESDTILVLGAIVASEIYGLHLPIVLLAESDWERLRDGAWTAVHADENGCATIEVESFEEMQEEV